MKEIFNSNAFFTNALNSLATYYLIDNDLAYLDDMSKKSQLLKEGWQQSYAVFHKFNERKSIPILEFSNSVNDAYKQLYKFIYSIVVNNYLKYQINQFDINNLEFKNNHKEIYLRNLIFNDKDILSENLSIYKIDNEYIIPVYLGLLLKEWKYNKVKKLGSNDTINTGNITFDLSKGVLLPYSLIPGFDYIL